MSEEYINAAKIIGDLAEEYNQDYDLSSLLRSKSSKIMKLAQEINGSIIKIASDNSVSDSSISDNSISE